MAHAQKRSTYHAQLSHTRVLAATLALIERDGLAALSMRKLAHELGVEAMTLYHYFPNKAALLDGLVEYVLSQVQLAPFNASGSWAEWLRTLATAYYATLRRHPKLLPLIATRPLQTPRSLVAAEVLASALCRAGFQPLAALQALNIVITFVVGHALAEFGQTPGEQAPPAAPDFSAALDPHAFPTLSAAFQAGLGQASEQQARFEQGIEALLTGFACWLAGQGH